MDAIIAGIYEASNFPGVATLIKLVQKTNPTISKIYIKKWYNNQLEIQLLHKQQSTKSSGHVVAFIKNEMWNVDIYDLSKYNLENGKMKYIFACVDVFTRKAYAEPMTLKNGENCAGALQSIIMEHKVHPRVILCDSDAAYFSKAFEEVLDANKIVLNNVVVNDHKAMGIIDNFAARLKLIFSKLFIRNKNHRWANKLQTVINTYNNTPHSSIGNLTPNDAQDDKNELLLLNLNREKQTHNRMVSDLKPGDKVRKLISKMFTKGTEPKFSEEVYEVVKVNGGTITIKDDGDIDTQYKRQNLLKVPNDA
jgi:hypothetical protein